MKINYTIISVAFVLIALSLNYSVVNARENYKPLSANHVKALNNFSNKIGVASVTGNKCVIDLLRDVKSSIICEVHNKLMVEIHLLLITINSMGYEKRNYYVANSIRWYKAFNTFDYVLSTNRRIEKYSQ